LGVAPSEWAHRRGTGPAPSAAILPTSDDFPINSREMSPKPHSPGLPDDALHLREGLLDRVEVGRVGRQEQEVRAPSRDLLPRALSQFLHNTQQVGVATSLIRLTIILVS
jgi:hypothetical protein